MNVQKTTIKKLRASANVFQKGLLQKAWEHFRDSGTWLDLRATYRDFDREKVRTALSNLSGSIGHEERGQQYGRLEYHLSLLGALLTTDGGIVWALLEKFFQFQRKLFLEQPEKNNATSIEIRDMLGLSAENTLFMGKLLSLGGLCGAPNNQDGSWSVQAMEIAEEFPRSGDLFAEAEAWVCRFYDPESTVFQDQHRQRLISGASAETAFVAMWFSPRMERIWSEAISPGITDAGYQPLRIDKHQHNNRVDDEIIAKIRESKFLVADFTGGRGGVYYEAGFAGGLNKPVIWLVEAKQLKKIHFDTRQFAFILWKRDAIQKLRRALRFRIERTIGQGTFKTVKS